MTRQQEKDIETQQDAIRKLIKDLDAAKQALAEERAARGKAREFAALAVGLVDGHLKAIVEMFKVVADKGAVAALEFMGNHLNEGDAVGEGDAEIWQAAKDKMHALEIAGQTCSMCGKPKPRCGCAYDELERGVIRLRDRLAKAEGIVQHAHKSTDGAPLLAGVEYWTIQHGNAIPISAGFPVYGNGIYSTRAAAESAREKSQ